MELKKHVITGGPCSGKTTTVEALRKKGFRIIEEGSRMLIEEQLRTGGDLVPWKRLFDFNVKLTELQLQLESRATKGVYFADRGIIDNLAYCEWGGIKPPPNLKEAARKAAYGKVFLLLPLPFFESDPVRGDTKEDAIKLTSLIKKAYQQHGYPAVEVPPFTVQERVEFILSHL